MICLTVTCKWFYQGVWWPVFRVAGDWGGAWGNLSSVSSLVSTVVWKLYLDCILCCDSFLLVGTAQRPASLALIDLLALSGLCGFQVLQTHSCHSNLNMMLFLLLHLFYKLPLGFLFCVSGEWEVEDNIPINFGTKKSGSLPSFRPIIFLLFPYQNHPGTLLWVNIHPSAKMYLEVKASGRSKTHYGLALSLDFWPTRSLSSHV